MLRFEVDTDDLLHSRFALSPAFELCNLLRMLEQPSRRRLPPSWAERLRTLAPAAGIDWGLSADALDMLLRAGVVEKALRLGWDVRELVGICRAPPHDSPSRAGLIWSVKPGDTIPDVRRSGCIIAYGNVRHIWKRVPLPADGSICLPWELTA